MTTARWQAGNTRVRDSHGQLVTRRVRRFAYGGVPADAFPLGTDTPSPWTWARRTLQICHIGSWSSQVFFIGVDHEDQFATTRTAQLIGRQQMLHWHWTTDKPVPELRYVVLIDGRGIPPGQWPQQRKIAGADVISHGWCPMPGNIHWQGECIHEPVTDGLGRFTIVPAYPGLLAGMAADQEDFAAARRTGGSGHGNGGGGNGGGDRIDAEQIMACGAPVGERNDRLHRLACSRYRRHGTGPDGAAAVLGEVRAAWEAGETAGMPWAEVLTLTASARRYIASQQVLEARLWRAWSLRRGA
jgi:hypothetical protein